MVLGFFHKLHENFVPCSVYFRSSFDAYLLNHSDSGLSYILLSRYLYTIFIFAMNTSSKTIPEFINVEGNHYTIFSALELIKKLADKTKEII